MAYGKDEQRKSEANVRSCLAVFGASLAFFCSVGFINAFGIFQEYYITHQLRHKSAFDISWLGSFCIFVLFGGAPIAGLLVDKFGPTLLLLGGSIGALVAIFMTSLCTDYWQFFLAQSFLLGVSLSFVFCPPMGVVSHQFVHNRGLALGLVVAGSSLGGVIWPIMLEQLLNHHHLSFGWTMRIVGFTMLPLLAISCLTVRPAPEEPAAQPSSEEDDRGEEPPKRKHDFTILRNTTFLLLCGGLAVMYLGMFGPFFYVASYATHLGFSTELSFYLVSAVNAASFFGRVLPGFIADKWGHYNSCIAAALSSGIVAFCWTAAHSPAGVTVWAIAYGFTSGAIMSLQGACAAHVASKQSHGTALGFLMGSVALTALFGTPICGQLVGRYGYVALSTFTGASLVVGSVLVAVARATLDGRILVAK